MDQVEEIEAAIDPLPAEQFVRMVQKPAAFLL
jgi:hypothetical protein